MVKNKKKKNDRGAAVGEGVVPDKIEFGTDAWKIYNTIEGIVANDKDPRYADRRRQLCESLSPIGNKAVDSDFINDCFTYAIERRGSQTGSTASRAKARAGSSAPSSVSRNERIGSALGSDEVPQSHPLDDPGPAPPLRQRAGESSNVSSAPRIMSEVRTIPPWRFLACVISVHHLTAAPL
jgi:hypothetical protein